MNTLKKLLIFFSLPILLSCNSGPKGNALLNDSILAVNTELKEQIKDDKTLINSFLKSFNEIQENLESIKSREKIITLNSITSELSKSKKDIIINDITVIYDLLNKNKQTLASIKKELADSRSKNTELEKLNISLIKQVLNQEKEIGVLKNKLNKLNIVLDNLNIVNEKLENESDKKTSELNEGHFAIGTYKGLLERGLINKKGGLINFTKEARLNPDFDKYLFSPINITEIKEISIAAKKVKLMTTHPESSFKLEDKGLQVKTLTIINPEDFWRSSKYLIIEVSSEEPPKSENKGKEL